MLTLLTEARFWTNRDDILIKDTDFGAFRFKNKEKPLNENIADGKESYANKRGISTTLDNSRPAKLRKSIKKLEDLLKHHQIVFCKWKDSAVVQMLLSNGMLIHICVNLSSGNIHRIAFDKFLVGKLIADCQISDAIITRMHLIIAYNQNKLTLVHLQKPNLKRNAPEKLSRMDPKMFNFIINGSQNRTIFRHLSCNNSFDMVAVWTKSSQNEVYPWRPTVRDQDRANVHIYKISRNKLESVCWYWTENDPISIEFSGNDANQLYSVEQKISRKGEVSIEIGVYEVKKKMNRISITAIPLQTQVCSHAFSPDNEKLMLGCIDGSLVIFDDRRGITHLVKAAFIPTIISWHCDSALFMVANEKCQFQCFDVSLSCIKNQLISEDMTPSNLLDLSGYFMSQPNLMRISWSKKPILSCYTETNSPNDCYLLLLFESGPMACLRFFGGVGLKGDVHTTGFTADVLIHKYLYLNHIEKAINLLLCLNWDTYGSMCLIALHKIANYIFKEPLSTERELQLQKALGSFHIPVKPLAEDTEIEFGDQVRDITRKFFQHLLRYRSYEKAFSLAIDITDEDLFMDLYNSALTDGHTELANDAYFKAKEILSRSPSKESIHSSCSHSSCSECTDMPMEDLGKNSKCSNKNNNNTKNNNHFPDSLLNDSIKHPPLPVFDEQKLLPEKSSIKLVNKTTKIGNVDTATWSNQLVTYQHENTNNNNNNYIPPLPVFSNSIENIVSARNQQEYSSTIRRINNNNNNNGEHKNYSESPAIIPSLTSNLKVTTYSKKQNPSGSGNYYSSVGGGIINKTLNPTKHKNNNLFDPPLPIINNRNDPKNLYPPPPPHQREILSDNYKELKKSNTIAARSLATHTAGLLSYQNTQISFKPVQQTTISSTLTPVPKNIVIDVIPKINKPQKLHSTDWKIPARTLGIPLTNIETCLPPSIILPPPLPPLPAAYTAYPSETTTMNSLSTLTSALKSSSSSINQRNLLLRSQSMFNINLATSPQNQPHVQLPSKLIHEHPMTLANIPPLPSSLSMNSLLDTGVGKIKYNKNKKSSMATPNTTPDSSSTLNHNPKQQHYDKINKSSGNYNQQPTSSILTVSQSSSSSIGSTKKESGEKNKVKFSDTVTVAVVSEVTRKDKPLMSKRINGGLQVHTILTDPKQELADSLPLCHPNDEYLKDFTPVSMDERMGCEMNKSTNRSNKIGNGENNQPTNLTTPSPIKVVHFGVV